LAWPQYSEDPERYRFCQLTIPTTFAVLWAGCLEASELEGRIGALDDQFSAFLELNQSILFGDWPVRPIIEALTSLKWYQQLLEWRRIIEQRDAGILIRDFPDMTRRTIEMILAMAPPQGAVYPAPLWRRGKCRLVHSRAEEDALRNDHWHAYSDPQEEQPTRDPNAPAPVVVESVSQSSAAPLGVTEQIVEPPEQEALPDQDATAERLVINEESGLVVPTKNR
jgi:hypothetical protein